MDGGLIIKIANATLLRILMAHKEKGAFDEYGAIKAMIGKKHKNLVLAIEYEYLDCAYVQTCPRSLEGVLSAVIDLLDEYTDYDLDSAVKKDLRNHQADIETDYQFVEWIFFHDDGAQEIFRYENGQATYTTK